MPGRARGVRLRIGVLLDALALEAWTWTTLQRLIASSYADIALVILCEPSAATPIPPRARGASGVRDRLRALLNAAYAWWEARYPCIPDACERRDGRALLDQIPLLSAHVIGRGEMRTLAAPDVSAVREADLDVLLDLSRGGVGGEIAGAARHGVWGLEHGDESRGFGTPPGFWEVFFGVPVSASSVYAAEPGSAQRRLLCQVYSATDFNSTRRNNNPRYWKAASLIPRKLEQLWRDGEQSVYLRSNQTPDAHAGPLRGHYGPPRDLQVASLLARRFGRALVNRATEILTLPQWILLLELSDQPASRPSQLRKILPPKDRFWADPHVIQRDGQYFVFFEELVFATGKGHISVLAVDGEGRCGSPVTVLERNYHLSYPSLCEHHGELYMIPESGDNGTIELYRCVEFPTKWVFVENLMEDIAAYDATVLRWQGRWWLFANVVENRGASSWDELFLFYSDTLVGGTWTPHRLNPIVSDVRRSRPAGAIIERDGELYRPSQDCSVRYGYAINLNRITKLSVDEYEEIGVGSIAPDDDRRIVGVHTYARTGRLTVLDALQPRLRF